MRQVRYNLRSTNSYAACAPAKDGQSYDFMILIMILMFLFTVALLR